MKKRLIAAVLSAVLLCLVVCSCNKYESGASFRFYIDDIPSTLDPQSINDEGGRTVAENVFEGLFRITADGTVEYAMCKEYTASDDGLIYTFSLYDDYLWSILSNNEYVEYAPVTAYDYEFAFKRLFSPETKAPTAEEYSFIKNGKKALLGAVSPDEVGVVAVDQYTLKITLDRQDPFFFELLAKPAAIPCNKEIFERTEGRYGLTIYDIAYNGPFVMSDWGDDDIVLKKNQSFPDADDVKPASVRLMLPGDDNVIAELKSGYVDALSVAGEQIDQLIDKGYNIDPFESVTWVMVMNCKNSYLRNENVRRALAYSFDDSSIKKYAYSYQRRGYSIVPPAVSVGGRSYRDVMGDNLAFTPDIAHAKNVFKVGLSELGVSKMSKVTILVPNVAPHNTMIGYVQQSWQRDLGAYINISTLNLDDILERVKNGDFDMAVVPIYTQYNSPEATLRSFASGGSLAKSIGFSDPSFDALLRDAKSVGDVDERMQMYSDAESILINAAVAVPLMYQTEYYVTSSSVSGIEFTPFSFINFIKAVKKD